jgi:prevent-host-death family protein
MGSPHTAVGSRELKTRLGTYLRQVRQGATFVITDRGIPVATLEPIAPASDDLRSALAGLVARGVLGGAVGERPALAPFEPIAAARSASEAILEDREDRF